MSRGRSRTDLSALEEAIGYLFRDKALLTEAVTHKSFHHENKKAAPLYNERLEFLGDSVIGLIIVEHLFAMGARYTESLMAKLKSYLVCEGILADVAVNISLPGYLLLGKGEESTGGRGKRSILADAFEAVVGAVYLDGGLDAARKMVLSLLGERITEVVDSGEFHDYKTELQEKTQALFGILPEYRVIKQEGEDHQRVFTVAVYIEGKRLAVASGPRIRQAESLAAKEAIAGIGE